MFACGFLLCHLIDSQWFGACWFGWLFFVFGGVSVFRWGDLFCLMFTCLTVIVI